jgi:hypothetical protein
MLEISGAVLGTIGFASVRAFLAASSASSIAFSRSSMIPARMISAYSVSNLARRRNAARSDGEDTRDS